MTYSSCNFKLCCVAKWPLLQHTHFGVKGQRENTYEFNYNSTIQIRLIKYTYNIKLTPLYTATVMINSCSGGLTQGEIHPCLHSLIVWSEILIETLIRLLVSSSKPKIQKHPQLTEINFQCSTFHMHWLLQFSISCNLEAEWPLELSDQWLTSP